MTWQEWSNRLLIEEQRIYPVALEWWRNQPFFDHAATFDEAYESTAPRVDSAVRGFARHRVWPVLSPPEAAMLWHRLDHASELAQDGAALRLGMRALPRSEAGMWRWLLLTAWRLRGYLKTYDTLQCHPIGGIGGKAVLQALPGNHWFGSN